MSHYNVAVFTKHGEEYEVDSLLAPFTENVEPGDPFAIFQDDDEYDEDPITHRRGYWFNPDARWDWYTVGGRWGGNLKLKKPDDQGFVDTDSARVRDVDFSRDDEAYQRALRFWNVVVDGKPPEDDGDYETIFRPEYYTNRYGSRETYAMCASSMSSYAFLTEDGEWVSPGNVGWFATDDATPQSLAEYEKRWASYLAEAEEQDLFVTIVDCHI